jgi:hypothetical protein
VIVNGNFENGTQGWTAKLATFTAAAPAHGGSNAAQLKTTKKTGKAQLYQSNISLQAQSTYELSFWAKSPSGKDLQVSLVKQSDNSVSYGLVNRTVDVTPEWTQFTINLTTTGFSGNVNDGRLRFRMPKGINIEFSIDDVSLTTSDDPTPPGQEMLIYDFNGVVTQAYGGFIVDNPPMANGNWTTPVDFANGTIYVRAHVRGIPEDQPGMKLGWCFWQKTKENCKGNDVAGVPGTISTWSFKVKEMWKKNGVPIDWTQPRTKNGFSVRNSKNDPVSDKGGFNWSGENPADWYPMDIRFTVVVVAAGSNFSGWENYTNN